MHFPESRVKRCLFLSLESRDAFFLSLESRDAFSWVWSQEMHFPESGVEMHFPESGVKRCIFLSLESRDAFSWVWSQEMPFSWVWRQEMPFLESGVKRCLFLSLESRDAFSWVMGQEMPFPESGVKRCLFLSHGSRDAFSWVMGQEIGSNLHLLTSDSGRVLTRKHLQLIPRYWEIMSIFLCLKVKIRRVLHPFGTLMHLPQMENKIKCQRRRRKSRARPT